MTSGQMLKEQGQLLAIERAGISWTEEALEHLQRFLATEAAPAFRFEEFRAYALFNGLTPPPSANAWGALPNIAARRGLIVWTGCFDSAQSKRTHAHRVMLWRRAA